MRSSFETAKRDARCEEHGDYVASSYPGREGQHWTACPTCSHRERETADAADRAARQAQKRADWVREWLAESGLQQRFAGMRFDDLRADTQDQRAVVSACRHFAATVQPDSGGALLLLGPPGTGKTTVAAAIVHSCIVERAIGATMRTAADLIREVRSTWRRDSKTTERELIDYFGAVAVLVLDDLGSGYSTDGEAKILFDVIDARYARKRPIVITSNLKPGEIRAAIGPRAADRLRDGATVLTCNWPSYRRPSA